MTSFQFARPKAKEGRSRVHHDAPAGENAVTVKPPTYGVNLADRLQAKLTLSSPNDPSEREAEQVAQRVMHMRDDEAVGQEKSQRETPMAEKDVLKQFLAYKEGLPRKPTEETPGDEPRAKERRDSGLDSPSHSTGKQSPPAEPSTEIRKFNGRGEPLPASERAFFEPRFGSDFAQVRVHTDECSDRAARSISARAFTLGSDVAFRAGEYRPGSHKGRWLLAHELTHVVQNGLAPQSAGHVVRRRTATVEQYQVQRGDTLEAIAERFGISVAHLIDANRDLIRTWRTPGGSSVKGFNAGEIVQIPATSVTEPSPTSESDQDRSEEDEGGLVDSLLSGASDVIDQTADAALGIVEAVADLLVSAKKSLIIEGGGEAGSPDDAAISELQARETRREELLAGGKKSNLAVAKALADATAMPHHYEDRSKKSHAPADILAGNEQAAQSILCSGFTALTLVEAGWDLSQEYIDPVTGLPIAYEDGIKEGKPAITFVNLFMITNQQPKAIAGALEAKKKGNALKIEGADVSRYVASGKFSQTPPAHRRAFLLSQSATFVGLEATGEEEVGAGLTAVALGGIEVDPEDRKPGDLQQTMKTDSSGKFTGAGHSSQVWSVRGVGVCYLGASGSPTIIPPNVTHPAPLDELEPGWYEINDASGLFWLVDKDISPDLVATLRADWIQLIDANVGRGGDATAVGTTKAAEKIRPGTTSVVTSNGRLPTSKWIAWVPNERVPVKAVLSSGPRS